MKIKILAILLVALVSSTIPFILYQFNSSLGYALIATLLIAAIPVFAQMKSKFDVFEPKWIALFLYLLYIVISPMYHILTDNYLFLGTIVTTAEYEKAMLLASAGVFFLWLGYYSRIPETLGKSLLSPKVQTGNINKINFFFALVVIVSFVLWLSLVGVSIKRFLLPGILTPEMTTFSTLTSQPYLFNFAFESWVAILLVWFAFSPKSSKWLKITVVAVVAIVYASYGARYRLLMLGALFVFSYLVKGKRPNVFKLGLVGTVVGVLFTWIGAYRWSVRSGMVIEITSFFDSFFVHNRILEPFAKIIQFVPHFAPFEYGKSFLYTLVLPIPRSIWPTKPDPYFRNVLEESIGTSEAYGSGLAYPNFGEYYQNFGAVGMFVLMFLFGVFLKTMYTWYLNNQQNKWVMIVYAMFLPFLYQVISRGYLGMIVQEAVFIFIPVFLLLFLNNKVFTKRFVLRKSYTNKINNNESST